MRTPQHSPDFLKKRQLLTFIPLPLSVFTTVLFVLGGGGKGVSEATAAGSGGLNTSLPSATKGNLFGDKMEAYKAPTDSSRRNGFSFAPTVPATDSVPTGAAPEGLNYGVQPGQTARFVPAEDPNVAAVQARMQQLQQQTYGPAPAAPQPRDVTSSAPAAPAEDPAMEATIKQLATMQAAYERQVAALEKPAAPKAPAAAAPKTSGRSTITILAEGEQSVVSAPLGSTNTVRAQPQSGNGFHGLGGSSTSDGVTAIPAVVHGDQVVSQGSTVKLRLLSDVQIEGRLVPRNSFLYGTCNVSGNRLTVEASNVQIGNAVLPLALKAFDLDGMEGLYIPSSINRDATKQGMASGASSADLLTMSPSLGAQAAGIALQTGKALAGNKIKLVKIHLKANYQLLLKP